MEEAHIRAGDGPQHSTRGLTADGEQARPHEEDWARWLRDHCAGCTVADRVRQPC